VSKLEQHRQQTLKSKVREMQKNPLKRPADGLHACWTTATMGEQEARTRTWRIKEPLT